MRCKQCDKEMKPLGQWPDSNGKLSNVFVCHNCPKTESGALVTERKEI